MTHISEPGDLSLVADDAQEFVTIRLAGQLRSTTC